MAAVMEVDADAVVVANPETKQVEVTTVQSSTAIRVAIESVGFEVTL